MSSISILVLMHIFDVDSIVNIFIAKYLDGDEVGLTYLIWGKTNSGCWLVLL